MKMGNYINPRNWVPIDGFSLESVASDVVKSQKNFLVVAGPGAGKTELLAQRACFLLQTKCCIYPRMILALSYKKDAEKNLRERIISHIGKEISSQFVSLTYDAFAKNLLDRFRSALPDIFRPSPNYKIMHISDAYKELFNIVLTREQNWSLQECFVRTIESLPVKIDKKVFRGGVSINDFWKKAIIGKEGCSILTFPMISILAEFIIKSNPQIKRALTLSYSYVFLDEFQDTTKGQYSLIKTCFIDTKVVTTAVGDDKQRIMVWAGAYSEVFEHFQNDFRATEKRLLMNFRSAPRLIAIQRVIINLMLEEKNQDTDWNRDKWREDDGESEIWLFNNEKQEAKIVAKKVNQIINEEVIFPRDVCIIVRQRPQDYSGCLISALRSHGILARVENDYQTLLSEELMLMLLNLLEIAVSLKAPQAYLDCKELFRIIRGVSANLEYEEKSLDVERELIEIHGIIKQRIYDIKTKDNLFDLLNQILEQIGLSAITSVMPQYRSEEYRNDLILKLNTLLWAEYQVTRDWNLAIANFRGESSVPIMTIHKSKGLEYNTVIFIGLEDNAFWNFQRASEEEIRNFFVALSRAKQRAIFTFTQVRNYKNNARKEIRSLYDVLIQSNIVEIKDFNSSV